MLQPVSIKEQGGGAEPSGREGGKGHLERSCSLWLLVAVLQPAQGYPAGRKEGNTGPELTLLPPSDLLGLPIGQTQLEPEDKWACHRNLLRSASEAESSLHKSAGGCGEGGNGFLAL